MSNVAPGEHKSSLVRQDGKHLNQTLAAATRYPRAQWRGLIADRSLLQFSALFLNWQFLQYSGWVKWQSFFDRTRPGKGDTDQRHPCGHPLRLCVALAHGSGNFQRSLVPHGSFPEAGTEHGRLLCSVPDTSWIHVHAVHSRLKSEVADKFHNTHVRAVPHDSSLVPAVGLEQISAPRG